MFHKCIWYLAAFVLVCKIHQLKARHIVALKLTEINKHMVADKLNGVISYEQNDLVRGIRSAVDVKKNCPCLTVTNRCSKKTSCLENTARTSN